MVSRSVCVSYFVVHPCFSWSNYKRFSLVEVIESRLNDCRGLQYKHAILGLKLLKMTLIYGSLSVLPRVHRLLHFVAPLKHYTNTMPINIKQHVSNIRILAREVQYLLLDWSLLMSKRSHTLSNNQMSVSRIFFDENQKM